MASENGGAADPTDTRTKILDATEQLMLDEGYAGVSYRKVMERAGLKSNLLHHYFKTMDDLFIAAFRRREDWHIARMAAATSSRRPLHDLWSLAIDGASSKLVLEYNALACHRPPVREFIARSAARDRISVIAALRVIFERYDVDAEVYPPQVVAMTMSGLAMAFSTEKALGADDGHKETLAYMERLIEAIEPTPRRVRRGKSAEAEAPAEGVPAEDADAA